MQDNRDLATLSKEIEHPKYISELSDELELSSS